jgi:hypothetical protein
MWMVRLALVLVFALTSSARAAPRSERSPRERDTRSNRMTPWAPRITAAHIVSRVGTSGIADDTPKRARVRDGVTLFAVIEAAERGEPVYFSDAGPEIRLGGRRRAARPLADAPAAMLFWFRVEPALESLSNTASGRFRYEPIRYAETGIASALAAGSLRADVRPTRTPDRGHGVGTMRYKLVAVTARGAFATPGAEARRGKGSGGLSDAVHRVSLRSGDTYLGYLGELFGQPYIWASAGASRTAHQSERLEGADCADFVVYGERRLGRDLEYTWTGDLPRVTRLLAAGRAGADGVYVDRRGRPLPFTRAGDLLLFPRHVGVLSRDRGVRGVLDREDTMLHAYFATPREQALGETDYAAAPVEVRRWR